MGELFHCGYPGRAPEQLRRIAEALDATVVDIRYSALEAREAVWSGTALRETLGDRYVRCIALADRAGCGAESISLIDLAVGVEFLRQIPGPMILLCGCQDIRASHRAGVALRLWTEYRWSSRELDWGDGPAFPAPSGARSEETARRAPKHIYRKRRFAAICGDHPSKFLSSLPNK